MTWVFGYGSLMWDGWETKYHCSRRAAADLPGYCRRFNKASIRNWGTRASPGPTLNLAKADASICRGMAFRFPSLHEPTILSYLTRREGQGFRLHELQIRLDDQSLVTAFVAIYEGPSVIEAKEIEDLAAMVVSASGAKGPCASYVVGVAKALSEIGIEDSAVAELESAVKRHPSFRDMGVP